MIIVPSVSTPANCRLYQDDQDQTLTYVDTLNPAAVHQTPIRWIPISDCQVSAVGEVQFGPAQKDFNRLAATGLGARPLPMPWQSGPVYVWTQRPEGIRRLAAGKTSGYGTHNVVFNGTTEPEAAHGRVAIAAELHCLAQLAQARLQAGGKVDVVDAALGCVPLGQRAPKMATLAEVLLPTLQQLVNCKGLVILANAKALSIEAIEELRQLVLTEWAHRIVTACEGKSLSLAMPAAQVSKLKLKQALDLEINWSAGDTVPVRVVRVLRAPGYRPKNKKIEASETEASETEEKKIEVEVLVEGDWQSYNFVEVSVEVSPGNTHSRSDITLTPQKTKHRCRLPPGEKIQAIAAAGVRHFGVKVPIKTIQVTPRRVTITLVPLKEKAFLVKTARSLLRTTGPLKIDIAHPALAKVLIPRQNTLTLCAEPEESKKSLSHVSAVYRALIWQNEQTNQPFQISMQPAHGPCIQWTETEVGDEIILSAERLSSSA